MEGIESLERQPSAALASRKRETTVKLVRSAKSAPAGVLTSQVPEVGSVQLLCACFVEWRRRTRNAMRPSSAHASQATVPSFYLMTK